MSNNGIKEHLRLLTISLLCAVSLADLASTSATADDGEYLTFLQTNLARYIAVSRRRVFCPTNTSLLHGELSQACADDYRGDVEASKSDGLQNYLIVARKYQKWFKPLDTSIGVSSDTPCHQLELTERAECVINRLSRLPMSDFWPFNPRVIEQNQRLAILSASGVMEDIEQRKLKQAYFQMLQTIQNVSLPYHPEVVLLSFRDGSLVRTLTEYGFPGNSLEFLYGGKHLFNRTEQSQLEELTSHSLQLILEVDESLHRAILQAIGVVAFYRSEENLYLGGSNGKLVGLIWLEPPTNWSVVHMAEELVHEFIHNVLFQAELVHGLMTEDHFRNNLESWSCIRAANRPYDKALHAAFVSTGLIHFHSKAYQKLPHKQPEIRAKVTKLLNTLDRAIRELADNHRKHNVLSGPGASILEHMMDVASLASII